MFRALCFLVALVVPLFFPACASSPQVVRDPLAPASRALVDLRKANVGLRFDIRYSTPRNFTGRVLYPVSAAWLRHDAAAALVAVQRDLQRQGIGLKVFDAYRPYHVQAHMWELIRDERYVSNPAKNAGRHTRGTAVDVTLVDHRGRELPMPTEFDDFSAKAHRDSSGIPEARQRNARTLEAAMAKHGFLPYPFEWWHFDFHGWQTHPPLDIPLSSLSSRPWNSAR